MPAPPAAALQPNRADAEALAELRQIAEDRFARPSFRIEARRVLKEYAKATCRADQQAALEGKEIDREPLTVNGVEATFSEAARGWWSGW